MEKRYVSGGMGKRSSSEVAESEWELYLSKSPFSYFKCLNGLFSLNKNLITLHKHQEHIYYAPTDLPRHGGLECGTIVQKNRKSLILF